MRMLLPTPPPPVFFEYLKYCNMPPKGENSAYIEDILHTPTAPIIQACQSIGYGPYSDDSLVSEQSHVAGKKDFKCSDCGQQFVRKSNLKAHMKVHEPKLYEERPYACGYQDCWSRFERQADLRRHHNSVSLSGSRRHCTSTDIVIETQPGAFVSMWALLRSIWS